MGSEMCIRDSVILEGKFSHKKERAAMMTATRLFASAIFSTMRMLEENGQVLFCGKDTAKTLGSADIAKAMTKHSEKMGGQYA